MNNRNSYLISQEYVECWRDGVLAWRCKNPVGYYALSEDEYAAAVYRASGTKLASVPVAREVISSKGGMGLGIPGRFRCANTAA